MSQGFRKSGDLYGVSDKTDITPPTRIDDQKNSRRAQQITHLHQQFEDLKKKIKEVQNKNEKIIEKIHKAYNFKKKNAYTQEYIVTNQGSPVVYYENRYAPGYSGAMSVDAHSNKSDQSQKQFKLQKRSTELGSRKAIKNQKFNYSMQYGKTQGNIAQQQDQRQAQMRYTSNQYPPPNFPPPNPSFSTLSSQNRLQKKLVQELNQQKMNLEHELSQKESEIYRLQSLMKNNSRNLKGVIQSTLEQFYQNVLHKNLIAIQKAFKKYELKLKNLKKISMMVKDKQEDRKSSRLLQYGRARRSQSRSRRSSPPRETRDSVKESKILNYSRNEIKDESRSRSRVAVDKQEKNKKQFQEIASKYEELIKSKTEQIEKWDKKYRLKQRQCYELKMRVDVLQRRLSEQEKKSSRNQSMTQQLQQASKTRKHTTESDLLADIDEPDTSAFEAEIANLHLKVQQLQSISNQKSSQISNFQNMLSAAESKNKGLYTEYQQNMNKTKQKYQQEQEKYRKQFDRILRQKNEEANGYKNNLMTIQKRLLEKQCQFSSVQNKIKKYQGLLHSKDKKIDELEKIVGENLPTDRSLLLASSMVNAPQNSSTDAIRKLKQEIETLQNKLQISRNEIFSLTKKNSYYKNKAEQLEQSNNEIKRQLQSIQVENEQLKINVNMNNISAVMRGEHEQNSREEDEVGHSLSVIDENSKKNNVDIQTLTQKMTELTRQKQEWYQKYQKSKTQTLQKQSQTIKIKSQLNFTKKQLQDTQNQIIKLKSENEAYKIENKELSNKVINIQQQMQAERQQFKLQINDIERRWAQFQDDMRKSGIHASDVEKSQKSSVANYRSNQNQYVNTQNQLLTVRLKQAEAEIEAQKAMEQKIIQEYQVVMEEYKIQLKNKGDHIKSLKEQIDDLNTKIHNLSVRLEMSNKNDSLNSTSKERKDQKNQLLERIQQLEAELKQTKQINSKLTDMEGQLFDQIKIKEQERGQLYEELRKKQMRVHELEEIIEMRNGEPVNAYGSHLSQSTHKRQSIKSQSSLKYSSHSQVLRKSRMLSSKGGNASEQRVFDLQLSDAGSQFFQQPSQISNISQFFQKQQLPYQKIKIKRQQQIKLFQKTASYIKSLKKAIEQKNKRIKLLQKKIQSLKSSELVRKQLGLDIQIRQQRLNNGNQKLQADDTFRDYQSVQLEYKRGGHLRRYKQLEHDTKLVMEENNLLIQQIQSLEEELLKAEEQENSLVKIKDLYKQQIKKLIKKNEEQTKSFEEQLKNERKRVEESESVHNIEAIKQLFTKIVQITGQKFTEQNMSTKKKEEKRKQLQEYIKVMSNILKLDKKAKQSLISALQK